jgi:hypothetical protein
MPLKPVPLLIFSPMYPPVELFLAESKLNTTKKKLQLKKEVGENFGKPDMHQVGND